jgi:hypothetical protein
VLVDRDRDRLARRLAAAAGEAAAASGDPAWAGFLAGRPVPGPEATPAQVGAWLGSARGVGAMALVREEALVPGLGGQAARVHVAVMNGDDDWVGLVVADTDPGRLRATVADVVWDTWIDRTGMPESLRADADDGRLAELTAFIAAADLPAADTPARSAAAARPRPGRGLEGRPVARSAPLGVFGNQAAAPARPSAPGL